MWLDQNWLRQAPEVRLRPASRDSRSVLFALFYSLIHGQAAIAVKHRVGWYSSNPTGLNSLHNGFRFKQDTILRAFPADLQQRTDDGSRAPNWFQQLWNRR